MRYTWRVFSLGGGGYTWRVFSLGGGGVTEALYR